MLSKQNRFNRIKKPALILAGIFVAALFLLPSFSSFGQDEPVVDPQQEIIDQIGFPYRFTIAYVPWGDDDKHLVRYETWAYPDHRKEITFIGGEILAIDDIPPELGESDEDAFDDDLLWEDEELSGEWDEEFWDADEWEDETGDEGWGDEELGGEGEWDEEQWIEDWEGDEYDDEFMSGFYDEWLYEDDYLWVDYPILSPDMIDFEMGLEDISYAVGTSDFQRVDALIEGFEEEGMEIYLGDNVIFCLQEGYLLYFEAFGTEVAY